jgi:hypothetical protein
MIRDMIDERLKVFSDTLGTACGKCTLCGAYFMVAVPNDAEALPALEKAFARHLAGRHDE